METEAIDSTGRHDDDKCIATSLLLSTVAVVFDKTKPTKPRLLATRETLLFSGCVSKS
eukprot:m.204060 g.204060  ORF g.204060 m.204060 type:complete len:58 (-) comp25300_c0_seq2:93-266(-)